MPRLEATLLSKPKALSVVVFVARSIWNSRLPFSGVVVPDTFSWTSSGTTWPQPSSFGVRELTPVAKVAPAIGLFARPVPPLGVGQTRAERGSGVNAVGSAALRLKLYAFV